ncbi:hypothetical protein [Thiohalophilus sp.]|uniref:hypothetical protein n=1 Tax=Thiohalophilus sp. TaxID=3028392 RepID=UPI002ACDFA28|nr:hypothetical protein [Thiohalophilus sp.]MDZ7662714.1 hypothetical protein [Thiohalophilus sp.]
MSNIKTLIVFVATAWLVAGCAGGMSSEQKQQQYQQEMSAAKAAYERVREVEYAWRDTEDLMKAAEKAAGEGELGKAIDLAVEARKQSEIAYNQYQDQKDAGEHGIR